MRKTGSKKVKDDNFEPLEDGRVRCKICEKEFASRPSFQNHRRQQHSIVVQQNIECPVGFGSCERVTTYAGLHTHLREQHGIDCKREDHRFDNEEEFQEWKDHLEQSTAVRFSSTRSFQNAKSKHRQFHCHRSGKPTVVEHRRRDRKKGTAAVGVNCPAMICVQRDFDGSLCVRAYLEHKGHGADGQGGYERDDVVQRFSKKLVNRVLAELKQGHSPFWIEQRLEKEKGRIWKGGDKYYERKHILLTRNRKLAPMAGRYDLAVWDSVNRAVGDNWKLCGRENSPYFFFRPPDTEDRTAKPSFALGLQTRFMRQMLDRYGDDQHLCVGTTTGTNMYGEYMLGTVMVVDETNNGLPGAFFISRGQQTAEIQPILEALKLRHPSLADSLSLYARCVPGAENVHHLETLHKYIKRAMGRRPDRADYLIAYLCQLSEDLEMKYHKRIADYSGQTAAQDTIQQSHEIAIGLIVEAIEPIERLGENKWVVAGFSVSRYAQACYRKCELRCLSKLNGIQCGLCPHMFTCTCTEYVGSDIRLCRHIHAVYLQHFGAAGLNSGPNLHHREDGKMKEEEDMGDETSFGIRCEVIGPQETDVILVTDEFRDEMETRIWTLANDIAKHAALLSDVSSADEMSAAVEYLEHFAETFQRDFPVKRPENISSSVFSDNSGRNDCNSDNMIIEDNLTTMAGEDTTAMNENEFSFLRHAAEQKKEKKTTSVEDVVVVVCEVENEVANEAANEVTNEVTNEVANEVQVKRKKVGNIPPKIEREKRLVRRTSARLARGDSQKGKGPNKKGKEVVHQQPLCVGCKKVTQDFDREYCGICDVFHHVTCVHMC